MLHPHHMNGDAAAAAATCAKYRRESTTRQQVRAGVHTDAPVDMYGTDARHGRGI